MKDIFRQNNLFSRLFTVTVFMAVFILLGTYSIISPKKQSKINCKNCNVVVIELDLLRSDAIDCKNNFEATPNLCGVIKDSVNFKNNTSMSDLTVVDQVSTFTSLYPSTHSFWAKDIDTYPTDTVSLPQYLKAHNFVTAVSEMERIYSQYNDKEWFNWFESGINFGSLPDWLKKVSAGNKRFFLYLYSWKLHAPYLHVKDEITGKGGYIPENIPLSQSEFDEILADYLAKNYKDIFQEEAIKDNSLTFSGDIQKNKKKLLALYYKYELAGKEKFRFLKNSWIAKYNTYFSTINPDKPEDIEFLKKVYLETLSKTDSELSEVLEALNRPEYKKNTIIIIKSNHGEEFYEHKRFSHSNNLYQELIHTPLTMRIPGVKPEDVNSLTENIDVMPTILDLLQMPIPGQVQGSSLVPLLADPRSSVRDFQIAQKGEDDHVVSFRKNDWKLIIKDWNPIELYNLAEDSGEKTNVISADKEKADSLLHSYRQIFDSLFIYQHQNKLYPTWIDEQKRQRLKDEGYF